MSNNKSSININQLAKEIADALSTYSNEVVEKINVSSEKVGKAAVKRLKQTSPKDNGAYAGSWSMKTIEVINLPTRRVIHVTAPQYRLTHLLEFGHVKVGGGRVSAKPHIRPAEQEVIEQFTKEVEEAIRDGSS